MAKNTRAKTVDRVHAYEVRFWRGEAWYALKYSHSDNSNPYSRVKVAHGDDIVGHEMYVREFELYPRIDNPLLPAPIVVDAEPVEE